MARRPTISDSGITQIVKQLEKANDEQQVISDTLIGFNPVLTSPIVYDVIDNLQTYMALTATNLTDLVEWASDTYDELVKGSLKQVLDNIMDEFTGNKMLEEENRREMLDALANIGTGGSPGNVPPPLPSNDDDGIGGPIRAGVSAGITQVIASRIAAMIPQSVKTMFLPLTAFFGNFLKFGKMLVKFAGPIGIAITVITGLIGAITGGIKGYKEGGIEGAIKGALIGAIDGLIGTIVKGIAGAVGWLLEAIGLDKLGGMLGPAVEGLFKGVYDIIGGFIEIFAGIFTLDADKVIGGLKKMFTGALGNFKILGKLLWTAITELVPLIGKAIKFALWDLPKFIGKMLVSAFYFIKDNLPGFISKLGEFVGQLAEKVKSDLIPWLVGQAIVLLGSLSVVITDLLGGIFNWFEENMNWETVKETVFAGVDFIQKMIDGVTNFVTDLIDGIVGFFSDPKGMLDKVFGGGAGDWIEDAYKKILRGFLPDPNGSLKNPLTWVGKIAIPDDVYEWANSPSKKEEDIGKNKDALKAAGIDTKDISEAQFADEAFLLDYIKKQQVQALPSSAGAMLSEKSGAVNNAPIIINQNGGNVTNTTTSQVNNNTSPFEPIMAGSSLGFVSL